VVGTDPFLHLFDADPVVGLGAAVSPWAPPPERRHPRRTATGAVFLWGTRIPPPAAGMCASWVVVHVPFIPTQAHGARHVRRLLVASPN
jgi:hypothetical protein